MPSTAQATFEAATATQEAAEATQQAVELQSQKLDQQIALLKDVGESIKGLCDILTKGATQQGVPQQGVPQQGALPQVAVPQGVRSAPVTPARDQRAPDPTRVVPLQAASTSGTPSHTLQLPPTTTQAQMGNQRSLLPPVFRQPAVDLMGISPANRHTFQQGNNAPSIQQQGISVDQYIDHYQSAAQIQVPATKGEINNQLNSSNSISHPYMYIQRYDVKENDYAKKFHIRNTISFEEYIHAYLKMLTVPNPPFEVKGSLRYHLDHMKDISLLSQTKPWEYVRFWSLFLFDNLETGALSWDEPQNMHNEKIRVMDLAHHLITTNVSICKAYQTGNCIKQHCDIKSHIVELSTQKHICAYCNRNEKAEFNHPEYKCRNKRGIKVSNKQQPLSNISQQQGGFPFQGQGNINQPIQSNPRAPNNNNARFQLPNQQFNGPPQPEGPRFTAPLNPQAQNFVSKN